MFDHAHSFHPTATNWIGLRKLQELDLADNRLTELPVQEQPEELPGSLVLPFGLYPESHSRVCMPLSTSSRLLLFLYIVAEERGPQFQSGCHPVSQLA